MRVLKIIQANAEFFNLDKEKTYTEKDAIRLVSALECEGSNLQKVNFEIRQTHTAICNLLSLGYADTAVDLALHLVSKAEWAHQYKIAQDLCDKLISHYFHVRNMEAVTRYKTLRDRFTLIISYEHDFRMLYGKMMYNYSLNLPVDIEEVANILDIIEKKLPHDCVWYHFSYFQCKALILEGPELESLLKDAIAYFEYLPFDHSTSLRVFVNKLMVFYLQQGEHSKVKAFIDLRLSLYESGSGDWFGCVFNFVKLLLEHGDIGANDVCIIGMNHARFGELDVEVKEEWKRVYKESVRLLLKH